MSSWPPYWLQQDTGIPADGDCGVACASGFTPLLIMHYICPAGQQWYLNLEYKLKFFQQISSAWHMLNWLDEKWVLFKIAVQKPFLMG